MHENQDYWIDTYEIDPPIGGNGYGAKVKISGADEPAGSFGEYFGRTEEEAEAKAQNALDAWLAKQAKT
jgi:hypothetical protein